jgi:hypothetical protein
MKLTSKLAGATAVSLLLAYSAFASENFSNILQNGTGNSGLVLQSGNSNAVGRSGRAAEQTGAQNDFEFTQSGNGNGIGAGTAGRFTQDSNRNTATITQSTDNNQVNSVTQTGITSTAGGVGVRRNTLVIDQLGGNGNVVNVVTQTRTSFRTARPTGSMR